MGRTPVKRGRLEMFLKGLIPPVLIWLYRAATTKDKDLDFLFDGDDTLFKDVLRKASLYGEYGCGKSTRWVLANTVADVVAVDTSQHWINEVARDNAGESQRLSIRHVDLGIVGDWGRLRDYSRHQTFNEYTDFIWKQPVKPNVVLIDGRFRVCCFLTSLKYADEGTHILFDDYVNRPLYHFVEKYIDRSKECGRQCLFIVPSRDKIDFKSLERDIANFRYVMD